MGNNVGLYTLNVIHFLLKNVVAIFSNEYFLVGAYICVIFLLNVLWDDAYEYVRWCYGLPVIYITRCCISEMLDLFSRMNLNIACI